MKRFILAALAAALLLALPLAAQETVSGDTYTVQSGDTLWELSGFHKGDPTLWRQLVDLNPFLQEKGRIFEDQQKRTIALIRPGEKLVGLEKLGIVPMLVPLDQLKLSGAAPVPVVVHETPNWVYWLLGLLGLLVLLTIAYLLFQRFVLDVDPVTSRPAVVPGGVTDATAPTAFQEMAARQHQATTGQTVPSQQFTVLETTPGRIWGGLNVRYADGREVPRRLNGERAYQARVRFPDPHLSLLGREETLYMLQGCGNDLRYGGISRYLPGPDFRFEADQPVVTAVASQVTAPPVQSASETKLSEAPQQEPQPDRMNLTKVQISRERGLTLEGDKIPLTVEELQELVKSIMEGGKSA